MSHFLITVGAVIALITVAAPIAAIFVVSVASRREESGHTLSGQAPGAMTRTARRLLAYRAQTADRPTWVPRHDLRDRPRSSAPLSSGGRTGGERARHTIEPMAIRLVPDGGQDRREPAGTHAA